MLNFTNHHYVITGGNAGIGLSIANALHEYGADITIISRKKLNNNVNSFNHIQADLNDPDAINSIQASIKSLGKKIDGLINNAAIAEFVPFEQCTEQMLMQHIRTNLMSPFQLIQALLPFFSETSSVLNISSYFSHKMLADRNTTMYSLTKGGLDSLTRSLASELGPHGIRVNAIAPGTTNTDMFKRNLNALNEKQQHDFYQAISSRYPLRRLGEPEDIAHMALFLCSPLASWVTGSIFAVDGGLTTQ